MVWAFQSMVCCLVAEMAWQKGMDEESCSSHGGQEAERQEDLRTRIYPSRSAPLLTTHSAVLVNRWIHWWVIAPVMIQSPARGPTSDFNRLRETFQIQTITENNQKVFCVSKICSEINAIVGWDDSHIPFRKQHHCAPCAAQLTGFSFKIGPLMGFGETSDCETCALQKLSSCSDCPHIWSLMYPRASCTPVVWKFSSRLAQR